ncbi:MULTISPECIES: NUDIX hydrolase [unclassified Acinetobacter]|uniref:NUDIX hydrolase n=1 Tax=unclassified Acinetobacter TaxID=196816 RepID=UPI0029348BDE|nr:MULTISPECIES: NUDIX hydrolase [unclassified Acinetobacter]WOE32658.1 NUDIX hydrolase [Acinetobacter sp. SAAs470]WOE38134.1 NUDIX hydrolase [Acinetobacter sp. SAAs474]
MSAWTAHVTVATVVEKDGKFLCVEEHTEGVSHTVFNQPAGHVECGETLIQAAIRETLEETGYDVSIESLLGIYSYTPPMFPDRTYYRFCFLAHVLAHHPDACLDDGIIAAVWMTLDEIKISARARSPLVIKALEDALSGQKYPLSLIYEHQNSPLFLNLDA